ncbi:MAG: alpha/beta fold hydrolase [Legionellaceae bacterium]|nr:alpha/beta fold hydrolase [Legionellaceae bacterium]
MNINDFHYMWRGRSVRPLTIQDAYLLSPIDVRRQDSGRALLLLHGFSSSPAIYRELLPSFTIYDAVLCPVLLGHADCIESFATSSAADWLDAARQAYETLAHRYDTIDVMGLSLGGVLACKLAEHFSINHLYLLAPALRLHGFPTLLLWCARMLRCLGVKRITNHAGNFHTDLHQELTYRQLPIPAIIEILTFIKKATFVAPRCPTDLFLGRYDEVVDSSAVVKLFADSSNTTIHWLNNSAHILPLDGDIETIANCVREHYPSN